MRVLFLNQYFPPDSAPTGMLFAEIAAELEKAGHRVDFVAARQEYRSGQRQGGRLLREMRALLRMLIEGLGRPRADVVVSGSSPPCLLVVATLVAWWHRARSVHWIMDLYPEIALALGEVRSGVFVRALAELIRRCYGRTSRVVVLDEDMAERVRGNRVEPAIVRPWVFAPVLKQVAAAHVGPSAEWTWIYSGNLGRAHEWETLLEAQAELERRGAPIRLLFQGGGPSRPLAEARARELRLRRVEWCDYASEDGLVESLLRCHALIVTQLSTAKGLLWPSKLALAMSLPRPLAWVGPTDGAIAGELRKIDSAGVFAPGESGRLAEWLVALHAADQRIPAYGAIDAVAHRAEALAMWLHLITDLS